MMYVEKPYSAFKARLGWDQGNRGGFRRRRELYSVALQLGMAKFFDRVWDWRRRRSVSADGTP